MPKKLPGKLLRSLSRRFGWRGGGDLCCSDLGRLVPICGGCVARYKGDKMTKLVYLSYSQGLAGWRQIARLGTPLGLVTRLLRR